MTRELDITPTPRVLQMLGEINLEQWRCLAELIDNSIDGFVSALEAGDPIVEPTIDIFLPSTDDSTARVSIKDNGPGMELSALESAVKAGWSGNDGLSKLGLFGMGFNIATARLGFVTEVWTSRAGDAEEIGVRIDLNELRALDTYKIKRETRPKRESSLHGTEIIISSLKADQRAYLARANKKADIRKQLARAYSPLLINSKLGPIRLLVGGSRVLPLRPCIWDESRFVTLPDGTVVHAVEKFDVALANRRYCNHCMRTLSANEESCPTGSDQCQIIETPRRVRGWVGIQRYLHKNEFGIDLIRNGRKIEVANRDLFTWDDEDSPEVEYPIDDPRSRGRFVGEIHLDHCQVSYTKNRFERDDPAWTEMVRVVRGYGPLRPNIAQRLGFPPNESPLYRLFQAFRRTSPQGKNGLWSRVMVVQDNERATTMAADFVNGDVEYQSDELWWKLVEEQDEKVLGDGAPGAPLPEGFLGGSGKANEPAAETKGAEQGPEASSAPKPAPVRKPLFELSRKYIHPTYRVEFEVEAFAVEKDDPDLPKGQPWILTMDSLAIRSYLCFVDLSHELFRSTTMTPLDALLVDLTHRTIEHLRGSHQEITVPAVLSEYRQQYCVETRLDGQEIIAVAGNVLSDVCRAVSRLSGSSSRKLYEELSESERQQIAQRMANRGVAEPKTLLDDGRVWEYSDGVMVRNLFKRHPELFLDGHFWEDPYTALDFGSEPITAQARQATVDRYDAYFNDAIWLANQTPEHLENASRDEVIRATCSIRLLRPDVAL